MNIQDRKKTLTVEELRRRYNLDSLDKDRKAIKLQKDQIIKVDAELNDFVELTTKNLKELQDQVDGNITTWFFNGVPTVENEPSSNWTTDEEKINHLGDLYYDQDTGYAYRWAYENNDYTWSKIVDADVVEALAVANAAQDTADSKRRVFVNQPKSPYDIGDIWIKDDTDLYRCRASRSEGNFNPADWIRATNYTDDTVALGTKAELDQFKTQVTENYVSNATLETTVNSITGKVEETYTYVTTVENQVVDITQTTNKVESGNELYITDSLESNALEYHVEGKCEQETRSGKNKFNINLVESSSLNGITLTKNENGTITLNGTTTSATTFTIGYKINANDEIVQTGDLNIKNISGTMSTKIISGSINHSASSTGLLEFNLYDSEGNNAIQSTTKKQIGKIVQTTGTLDENITYNWADITISNSVTCDNLVLGLQVEQGEETEFEQYGASPSPDYPSEIKSIPSIRNLFDKDNANILNVYPNNNTLVNSPTSSTLYIECKPNTTYTASRSKIGKRFCLAESSTLPIINGTVSNAVPSNFNNELDTITITTSSSAKYLLLFYSNIGGNSFVNNNGYTEEELRNSIMIEEGSIAHDYVPYGSWLKTKLTGKNIFDGETELGSYSITDGSEVASTTVRRNVNPILVKPSTIYAISQNKIGLSTRIYYYDANYNFISTEAMTTGIYTTPANCYYINFISDKILTDYTNIQIEKDEITEYEPYKEKEVLIDLAKENLLETPYTESNKLTATATKNDYYAAIDYYAELEADKTYTFSCKTDGTFGAGNQQTQCYLLFDKKHDYIIHMDDKNCFKFKPTQTGKYYVRYDVNVKGETHSFWDFAIYKGTNADSSYELNSIGDTKDRLEIVNGVANIQKRIGKVVLNGTENWHKAEKGYLIRIDNTPFANNNSPFGYCDKFKFQNSYETWTKQYYCGFNAANTFWIRDDFAIATTVEEFKSWLKANPVTVYYELATPETITLPNTNIPLYEGVNHVTLVEDLETTTSIKYYRNTPIAQDYVVQQQLDETNSNLSNTDNKVSQAQSDINTTNTNLNNNYYNKEQIDVMNTSTEQMITQIKNTVETTTSATNLQISILQEQLKNGVTQVITETGYRFDKEGLLIQKTGSEMSSLLDNDGLVVKRNTTEVLTVRSSGVETENLKVRTYFTIGTNTRVENYKNGTGFFYVGGAN